MKSGLALSRETTPDFLAGNLGATSTSFSSEVVQLYCQLVSHQTSWTSLVTPACEELSFIFFSERESGFQYHQVLYRGSGMAADGSPFFQSLW